MVHIASTLIITTAVVVPVLSAPLRLDSNPLEEREPRGFRFKTAAKVAGNVATGVSIGATVGGMMQQRDLDIREPVFALTGSQIWRAATIASKVKKGLVGARKVAHYGKSGIEFGAAAVPSMNTRPQQRDLEDPQFLEARRLSGAAIRKIFSGLAGAAGFAGTVAAINTQRPPQSPPQGPHRREVVDLDTREPGLLEKSAGLIFRDENGDIYVRELDGLEQVDARDPEFFLREAPGFDELD
ncbi:hypothetical protein M413DRAFT_420403 [Hebeloma cylindrosporum]|uniref:Uncharacterized protein n=1 Tax=Hebeloma cylindrosporum TaxID=76867 RepID=A0A0C2XKM0_HEBCY|nr:hypothetical protein M413DRAFT_420403 [Hebeloma cylindrosporum h7]